MAGNPVLLPGNQSIKKRIFEYRYVYALIALPFLYFLIFRYLPLYGIILAFKQYTLAGIIKSPWVGFANFERMWISPDLIRALKNTLIISIYRIVFGFPFPVMLALIINEIRAPRFSRIMQVTYTVPHFLSWVVVGGLITIVLGDSGIVKNILNQISPPLAANYNILYNARLFRGLLVSSALWKEIGWSTIIYLAVITSIDQSLYESAIIDGCNRFQLMIYITLPSMVSLFCIQLVLSLGVVMDGAFDQVFNLITPPTISTGDTIDTYIYRQSFQTNVAMDYGYTTAVGLFKNVINFILLLTTNRIVRKMGGTTIL